MKLPPNWDEGFTTVVETSDYKGMLEDGLRMVRAFMDPFEFQLLYKDYDRRERRIDDVYAYYGMHSLQGIILGEVVNKVWMASKFWKKKQRPKEVAKAFKKVRDNIVYVLGPRR